jgi:uncharacterized protein (DUF305 family)
VLNKQLLILSLCGTIARAQTPPDVAFMQGMILHHGQALTMARMIPTRTTRADFRLLGERIIVSQTDETALMTRWLKGHNAAVPMLEEDSHEQDMRAMHAMPGHAADSAMHHALMPGMLSAQELRQLAAQKDSAFEQAFLDAMIRHHQGALKMVRDLLATQGGARDPYVARFAADVDADQSAEIARMRTMLVPSHPDR